MVRNPLVLKAERVKGMMTIRRKNLLNLIL
jgi:hypothetical protein